jgi:DNA-binding Lrp family transcriptional regulator
MESSHTGRPPKILRPGELDDIDHAIVRLLADDGRMTNAELAAGAGISPSTAHVRLKALRDRGVITGIHASVDERMLGRGLLRPAARKESITAFADEVRGLAQVIQVFFLGGTDDFMIHIAVEDSSALRTFVLEHLSGQRYVASTRTSIVFDYHRNAVAASFK